MEEHYEKQLNDDRATYTAHNPKPCRLEGTFLEVPLGLMLSGQSKITGQVVLEEYLQNFLSMVN